MLKLFSSVINMFVMEIFQIKIGYLILLKKTAVAN